MTQFLQLLVLGMATGAFYAMSALGLVVVFRSSSVINFATGAAAMAGGYVAYTVADLWGWPRPLALPLAVLAAAALGLLVYLCAIRPLKDASALTKVIATLSLFVGFQQLVQIVYGGLPKIPRSLLPTFSVHLGTVTVGVDSLIIVGFTIVLTAGLWWAYRSTRFGLATSALAESPRSLAALGWRVGPLRGANWAIGGALAGVAGAGLGPILQLTPAVFTSLLIPTLAVAIIGGLRSFPLTLAGGLFVGAAQAEANRYVNVTGASQAIPFLVIILVLVLRGSRLPLRSFVQERLPRVGWGEISALRLLAGVVAAAILVSFLNPDLVAGATITVVVAIVLLSQVVVTGFAGQLSLAQLTLGGIGALAAVHLSVDRGAPFLVALLAAMAVTVPISVLVGLPALRARGVSLAIATLGLAVAIYAVILQNQDLTGGVSGFTLPSQQVFGLSIDPIADPYHYFLAALAIFVVLGVAAANVRRGRTGRRMLAVRTNERAAAALGVNVTGTKLYAFVLSGLIAAVGGVLLTYRNPVAQFTAFDPIASLTNLIAAVIGGIGYILGALFGGLITNGGFPTALLFPVTQNLTWWNNFLPMVTGFGLVAQLIANPNGIVDVIARGSGKARKQAPEGASKPSRFGPLRALTPSGTRAAREQRRQTRHRTELAQAIARPRAPRRGTLSVSDVLVRFGTVTAVDGVSLTVEPGEVVSVIGPNGAGKTTLMDAITGFVPMSGRVHLDGRRIDGWSVHRRARAGVVRSFQSLELLEDMTVIENLRAAADPHDLVAFAADLVHPGRDRVSAATAAAVSTFRLADKLERVPPELSYGDRRLVAIARAVAAEPSVLLLDEPAAGLSSAERTEVGDLIALMAREWGVAILLIEHDVELVRRVSTRVVALNFGRQIASGSPAEVLGSQAVAEAYLGEADERPSPPSRAESDVSR